MDTIIAEHIYREGNFEIGAVFEKESGIQVLESYKKPFIEMYNVLQAMKQKNLEPALKWCEKRRNELKNSKLEFICHRLRFIQLLTSDGVKKAIEYAKKNFPPFAEQNMNEIKYLMGSLLFASRLKDSPYKDLLDESQWEDAMHLFTRECCHLSGKSIESPLFVSVTAGSKALPTLCNLLN